MYVYCDAPYWTVLLYIASARGFVCMSSGRLPIGQRCFILRVLEVVCACLVGGSPLDSVALYCECYRWCVHGLWEAPYWTSLLYIVSARGCVCMSSGRLPIVHHCFIL